MASQCTLSSPLTLPLKLAGAFILSLSAALCIFFSAAFSSSSSIIGNLRRTSPHSWQMTGTSSIGPFSCERSTDPGEWKEPVWSQDMNNRPFYGALTNTLATVPVPVIVLPQLVNAPVIEVAD